jgi:glycosyltransferase involved in cell wall biosynthesis
MRIALDCRTVTAPKTGDRTYALGLSQGLVPLLEPADELLYYTWEPTSLAPSAAGVLPVVLPAQPRWTWTPLVFPRDLRRRRADVAHVQYLVPPWAPCPVVTTIHDLAFRRFPGLFPVKHRLLLNWLIPLAARHAAHVITGSEATRRDLCEFYHLPAEAVTVTPYAADPQFRPQHPARAREAVRRRLGIPGPYVLSVGVLQPRKNLPRLVRAYGRIAARFPHRLVLVGKEGWANAELRAAAASLPVGKEAIFTGYVADADLPALYAGADLFVYPSLYEGFGLPPLEAMACGTPVLTSNTSSLPEVVGEAGRTVDPTDERALSLALEALLADPAERARLRAAGQARAAEFSWERTARETLAVYRRLAREPS